jgi:hypothetical protein
VVLIAVAAVSWANEASACSCLQITDVRDHARSVDAIFSGTATHRSNVAPREDSRFVARLKRIFGIQPKYSPPQIAIDFRIDESIKGARSSPIRIYTPDNSAACGFDFELGKRYLVFTYTVENRHEVSLCSATSPYEGLSSDFLQHVREAVRGSSN